MERENSPEPDPAPPSDFNVVKEIRKSRKPKRAKPSSNKEVP